MNDDLLFLVNMFFSLLEFSSFTLLSLTIYRIPIMLYWKRLLVMQFVFLAVMLTHDYILHNKDFYILSIACTAIILTTILLRIPFLYSALIWGTGYLINILIQSLVIYLVTSVNLVNADDLVNNPIYRNAGLLFFSLLYIVIVYYMDKKRLGFMFIMNRFRIAKRNLQLKDILIATLFLCTVSLGQVAALSITSNQINQSFIYVLIAMIVISSVGLYITYKLNIKEIEERFNALRGKNR
jgi:hypothetical protein